MCHMYDFDLKNLFVSSFAIINKSEDFMVSYYITRNKSNYTNEIPRNYLWSRDAWRQTRPRVEVKDGRRGPV